MASAHGHVHSVKKSWGLFVEGGVVVWFGGGFFVCFWGVVVSLGLILVWFFETGLLCVALAILELTL